MLKDLTLFPPQKVRGDARAQIGRSAGANALVALSGVLVIASRDRPHIFLLEEACVSQQALKYPAPFSSPKALICAMAMHGWKHSDMLSTPQMPNTKVQTIMDASRQCTP